MNGSPGGGSLNLMVHKFTGWRREYVSEGVVGNGRGEDKSMRGGWFTDSRLVPSQIGTLPSSCAIRGEFQVFGSFAISIFPRIS